VRTAPSAESRAPPRLVLVLVLLLVLGLDDELAWLEYEYE
jgi:hypothetical protein